MPSISTGNSALRSSAILSTPKVENALPLLVEILSICPMSITPV